MRRCSALQVIQLVAFLLSNTIWQPFIFKLPLKLLHLISDGLDVQSLCQLACTCRHLNRSLLGKFHAWCGLNLKNGSDNRLSTRAEEDQRPSAGLGPNAMFEAF